mgnify:CR=1 FL=1
MPGAAGTVKLQNVQEIFGVSKKLCLSFAEHVGIKHVGVHDLTPLRHCPGTHYKFVMDLRPICRGRWFASSRMSDLAIYSITSFSARQQAHIVRPYRWHTITIPSTSLKTRLFPHHHIPGPSRLSHLHTKTVPSPIKSGVQHRFFLSYSINSIIMLCAFCACSPIRQALSPAQNRSLPSPQSGQTNRPHKQSADFSGQAGQCPGALSRSSA